MADLRGFIATVLEAVRVVRNGGFIVDVKSDPGGGGILDVEHMGPPGDDSPPLPSDSMGVLPVDGTGRGVATGYVDNSNEGIALPGERRTYARDSSGAIQASMYMENDGAVTIDAADGSTIQVFSNGTIAIVSSGSPAAAIILFPFDGSIFLNGVLIDSDGNIVLPSGAEITNGSAVTLGGHTHAPGTLATPTESVTTGVTAVGSG